VDKARLRSYEIGRSDDWRSPASSAGSDNGNCSDLASVRILAIFKLKFEACEKKTLVLVEIVVNKVFRGGNKLPFQSQRRSSPGR
jgi:hypothetical protein